MNGEKTVPGTPSQALARLAQNLGEDQERVKKIILSVLRLSVKNREPTAEEINAFCIICAQNNLNPIAKEVAGFVSQSGQIIAIVMIDGWHKIVNSRPDFNGYTCEYENDKDGKLLSCTVKIFVKNRDHPSPATAWLSECRRNTAPWNTTPHRMLFVRAYCYAARAAFGLGALYDPDDAETIIANDRPSTAVATDDLTAKHEKFKAALTSKAPQPVPPAPAPIDTPSPEVVDGPVEYADEPLPENFDG